MCSPFFVTWYIPGVDDQDWQLRGCLGTFTADRVLREALPIMARRRYVPPSLLDMPLLGNIIRWPMPSVLCVRRSRHTIDLGGTPVIDKVLVCLNFQKNGQTGQTCILSSSRCGLCL